MQMSEALQLLTVYFQRLWLVVPVQVKTIAPEFPPNEHAHDLTHLNLLRPDTSRIQVASVEDTMNKLF